MNVWNSVIFLKTNKDMPKDAMSKMQGVKSMWSTSGDWGDFWIMLDSEHSTPDKTEMFVSKLKQSGWVAQTKTCWWKQMESR